MEGRSGLKKYIDTVFPSILKVRTNNHVAATYGMLSVALLQGNHLIINFLQFVFSMTQYDIYFHFAALHFSPRLCTIFLKQNA
jgi:hypothetical protein